MLHELLQSSFWESLLSAAIEWTIAVVPKLFLILILFLISKRLIRVVVARIQTTLKRRYEREGDLETEKRTTTLLRIVQGTLIVVLTVVFVLISLRSVGLDIAPLLAGAGIVGLAVGFGAQELVRDVISGFFMLLENQLRVGDVVNINGTGGVVEAIELRTITLRDLQGVVHVFQNGKINTLANMTKEWSAMVFDIGVAYKEDIDKVSALIAETAAEQKEDAAFGDMILEPVEVLGLDQFGDSALVIKARIKTKPGNQWLVGRNFRKRLKLKFDEHNIEIPFPHRTIYWGEKIDPLKLSVEEKAA